MGFETTTCRLQSHSDSAPRLESSFMRFVLTYIYFSRFLITTLQSWHRIKVFIGKSILFVHLKVTSKQKGLKQTFIYLLMVLSKCSFNFQHVMFTLCIFGVAATTWSGTKCIFSYNNRLYLHYYWVHCRSKENAISITVQTDYGFNFLRRSLFLLLFRFRVFLDKSCVLLQT